MGSLFTLTPSSSGVIRYQIDRFSLQTHSVEPNSMTPCFKRTIASESLHKHAEKLYLRQVDSASFRSVLSCFECG